MHSRFEKALFWAIAQAGKVLIGLLLLMQTACPKYLVPGLPVCSMPCTCHDLGNGTDESPVRTKDQHLPAEAINCCC